MPPSHARTSSPNRQWTTTTPCFRMIARGVEQRFGREVRTAGFGRTKSFSRGLYKRPLNGKERPRAVIEERHASGSCHHDAKRRPLPVFPGRIGARPYRLDRGRSGCPTGHPSRSGLAICPVSAYRGANGRPGILDRDGNIAAVYPSQTKPDSMRTKIESLLDQ